MLFDFVIGWKEKYTTLGKYFNLTFLGWYQVSGGMATFDSTKSEPYDSKA